MKDGRQIATRRMLKLNCNVHANFVGNALLNSSALVANETENAARICVLGVDLFLDREQRM